MACSFCRQTGHNIRTCQEAKASAARNGTEATFEQAKAAGVLDDTLKEIALGLIKALPAFVHYAPAAASACCSIQ